MVYWACGTMIAKPNFKVKLETNEHLKKVFPEETELFYIKMIYIVFKYELLSTFKKFMVYLNMSEISNSHYKIKNMHVIYVFSV